VPHSKGGPARGKGRKQSSESRNQDGRWPHVPSTRHFITSIYQPTNAHIISHKTLLKHFRTLRHGGTDIAAGRQLYRCIVPKAVHTVKSAAEDGRVQKVLLKMGESKKCC